MSIVDRLFFRPFEEEQEEAEALAEAMSEVNDFVARPYFPKVLSQLKDLEARNKTRPDSADKMLYQTGVRDGIELARLHLESLVERVRRG